jgi:hypothetical protein
MTRSTSTPCSDRLARELSRILRDAHRRMDLLGYPPADEHPFCLYTPDLTWVTTRSR